VNCDLEYPEERNNGSKAGNKSSRIYLEINTMMEEKEIVP
jgi:hypothetical protein